jgi:hypothetical protein
MSPKNEYNYFRVVACWIYELNDFENVITKCKKYYKTFTFLCQSIETGLTMD